MPAALLIELTLHTKRKLQREAAAPDLHLPRPEPGPFRALTLRRVPPKRDAGHDGVTWNAQCSRCALVKSASGVEQSVTQIATLQVWNNGFPQLQMAFSASFPHPLLSADHPHQQRNRVPKTTEGGDDISFRGSPPRLGYTDTYLTRNALGVVNGRYCRVPRGRNTGAFVEVGSCNFSAAGMLRRQQRCC